MPKNKGYCYFARPIDFADRYDATSLAMQSAVEDTLAKSGYSIYHPAYAWQVNGPMHADLARAIESSNRFALRRASAVVAWLPEGVQTQGVPMEIEFASRELGLPVIVLGKVGASLMGNPLVSCLPESDVEKVGRQLDLMAPDVTARNNPTIRYSSLYELNHAHPGDAGVDLRASHDIVIEPGEHAFVPSSVQIAIPSGMFGWIVARSSTFGNHGLLVLPGVIDAGYQGYLGISCVNLTGQVRKVYAGDRLGQFLLLANMWPGFHLERVDTDDVFPAPTSRGSNGFGSSGR